MKKDVFFQIKWSFTKCFFKRKSAKRFLFLIVIMGSLQKDCSQLQNLPISREISEAALLPEPANRDR